MSTRTRPTLLVLGALLLGALVLALSGCEEPKVVGPPVRPGGGAGGPKRQGPPGAQVADAGAAEEEAPRFTDDDFVEIDVENRDPFRSYAKVFKVEAPQAVQRRVLMPDTSVDQMRLVAIISGVAQPRAMLLDPSGVGHVIKRGDYLGRAEVIQAGGAEGMPVTLNWRVNRIRPNEVVLAREDPTEPNRPPLTRVVPLYSDEERRNFELPDTL